MSRLTCMTHRLALLALALPLASALSLGCSKSAKPATSSSEKGAVAQLAPSQAAASRESSQVLGILELPDGLKLADVRDAVTRVFPALAGDFDTTTAEMVASLKTTPGLEIDPHSPMTVVLLDPKKHAIPFVLLGTLSGGGADPFVVRSLGEVSAFGTASAIEAVADDAQSMATPTTLTLTLFPQVAVRVYRDEISAYPSSLAPSGSPIARTFKMLVERTIATVADWNSVVFTIERRNNGASLVAAIHADSASSMAAWAKLQEPATFALFDKLPSFDVLTFAATLQAGPFRESFQEMFERFYSGSDGLSKVDMDHMAEAYDRFSELMTGEFAGSFSVPQTTPQTMSGIWLARLTGAGDPKQVIDEMMGIPSNKGELSFAGIKQSSTYVSKADTHKGVDIAENRTLTTRPNTTTPEEMSTHIAVLNKTTHVQAMNDLDGLKRAIDGLVGGRTAAQEPRLRKAVAHRTSAQSERVYWNRNSQPGARCSTSGNDLVLRRRNHALALRLFSVAAGDARSREANDDDCREHSRCPERLYRIGSR